MFGSEWNGIGGLLGLLGIGGKVVDDFKTSLYNEEKRQSAISNESPTYIDRKGRERSARTGNEVRNLWDSDGYRIKVDAKTNEVLSNDQRNILNNKQAEAKSKAKRAGYDVYRYRICKRGKSGFPTIEYECRRTKDDKIVCRTRSTRYYGYGIPTYGLLATGNDEWNIANNRRIVYEYCKEWYIDTNMKGPHPYGMKEKAKEYGITIFENDIDYCVDKIMEASKNGTAPDFDERLGYDKTYSKASWVDEKYWI